MEVIYIFDWLGDFIGGIGSAIGEVFDFLGEQISNAIWNTMIQWLYETIYNAVADFFTMMGNMGADVFDLEWCRLGREQIIQGGHDTAFHPGNGHV